MLIPVRSCARIVRLRRADELLHAPHSPAVNRRGPESGRAVRKTFRQALVVVGALAWLSACGSSSTSTAPGGASAGGGNQATAPQACSVITQSEAAALLGSSVTKQDSGHICLWSGANGGSLNVQAYAPGTDPQVTVRSGHACGFGAPSTVTVGDAAVYCSTASATGSSVVFAKSGLLIQIQCSPGSSSTTPCDKSSFIAAAATAAGRL